MAAAGGLPGGATGDFEAYLGLKLNENRIASRREAQLIRAAAVAAGEVPGVEWYEAQTDDPAEARLWRAEALQDWLLRRAGGG